MPIAVENVSYTYLPGTPFEHRALKNVSFTIEDGEFVGIIGHTGSGKSTLIQIIKMCIRDRYNTNWHSGETCDACGGALYIRDDDNESTARKRFDVYMEPVSYTHLDGYKRQVSRGFHSAADHPRGHRLWFCRSPHHLWTHRRQGLGL